jgi:sugar phosphate permease
MLALRVFVPFALGYFLSYLFRVVNAVIAPDLIRDVGLDASSLGLLTSAYFLTFAAFQLPLGVLLDRLGPRRTEATLLVFAALGAIVFGWAETTGSLILGRALIGFGVSACLMAAFKAFVIWFPRDRLPFVNGCQMAAGGLGAITGTMPVEAALDMIDWRGVFFALGALTLVVALIILMVVPERKGGHGREPFRAQLEGIGKVFTSSLFWRAAPLTVSAQATFLAIQGLWAGPWLRDVAGMSRAEVADHLLLIAVAMVAGFLSIGWAAQKAGRLGLLSERPTRC